MNVEKNMQRLKQKAKRRNLKLVNLDRDDEEEEEKENEAFVLKRIEKRTIQGEEKGTKEKGKVKKIKDNKEHVQEHEPLQMDVTFNAISKYGALK